MLEVTAMTNGSSATSPPGFREYGVECIERALNRMLALSDRVHSAEDDEAVHDMRVASRRLRAAIAVFGPAFPGKRYGRFRRHVKELTDSLSRARDLDVMIASISELSTVAPASYRAGIEGLREALVKERGRLQKTVRKSLRRLHSADLMAEFQRIAAERSNAESNESEAMFAEAIRSRLDEVWSWQAHVHDPGRVYELHQMRIAVKRLRYTMELFAPLRGPLFAKAIDRVRGVQEHLGKIHDADVLAPALLAHLRQRLKDLEENSGQGIYAVDIPALNGLMMAAGAKHEEREERYQAFLTEWRELQESALFDQIRTMAEGPGE
jgi:CHAD domain-containing protein